MSNSTEFKVGDRVELVDKEAFGGHYTDEMEVTDIEGRYITTKDHEYSGFLFLPSELKHLEAHPIEKEFRFFRRSDAAISQEPYDTFEAALAGWKAFAQDGQEVEIIEVVSHGTYKATLKIEEA
jgi:hypothetical protein